MSVADLLPGRDTGAVKHLGKADEAVAGAQQGVAEAERKLGRAREQLEVAERDREAARLAVLRERAAELRAEATERRGEADAAGGQFEDVEMVVATWGGVWTEVQRQPVANRLNREAADLQVRADQLDSAASSY